MRPPRRDPDDEHRPRTEFGLDSQVTAVEPHDFAGDGETQPTTSRTPAPRRVNPIEADEERAEADLGVEEVGEQRLAFGRHDALRVELHAHNRQFGVAHALYDPVLTGRTHLKLRREIESG